VHDWVGSVCFEETFDGRQKDDSRRFESCPGKSLWQQSAAGLMQSIPKDEWIPRFTAKLREHFPEVSSNEAMTLALAEALYVEAVELTPERAVENYLLEAPPGRIHQPRVRARRVWVNGGAESGPGTRPPHN
jgi:hypothetical protein